jgi:hypothetical protein
VFSKELRKTSQCIFSMLIGHDSSGCTCFLIFFILQVLLFIHFPFYFGPHARKKLDQHVQEKNGKLLIC